jgi:hypothetical protein
VGPNQATAKKHGHLPLFSTMVSANGIFRVGGGGVGGWWEGWVGGEWEGG